MSLAKLKEDQYFATALKPVSMRMVPKEVFQMLDLCCMPWLSAYQVLEGILHCITLILNYGVWNAPHHPQIQQQKGEIPHCKKPNISKTVKTCSQPLQNHSIL